MVGSLHIHRGCLLHCWVEWGFHCRAQHVNECLLSHCASTHKASWELDYSMLVLLASHLIPLSLWRSRQKVNFLSHCFSLNPTHVPTLFVWNCCTWIIIVRNCFLAKPWYSPPRFPHCNIFLHSCSRIKIRRLTLTLAVIPMNSPPPKFTHWSLSPCEEAGPLGGDKAIEIWAPLLKFMKEASDQTAPPLSCSPPWEKLSRSIWPS